MPIIKDEKTVDDHQIDILNEMQFKYPENREKMREMIMKQQTNHDTQYMGTLNQSISSKDAKLTESLLSSPRARRIFGITSFELSGSDITVTKKNPDGTSRTLQGNIDKIREDLAKGVDSEKTGTLVTVGSSEQSTEGEAYQKERGTRRAAQEYPTPEEEGKTADARTHRSDDEAKLEQSWGDEERKAVTALVPIPRDKNGLEIFDQVTTDKRTAMFSVLKRVKRTSGLTYNEIAAGFKSDLDDLGSIASDASAEGKPYPEGSKIKGKIGNTAITYVYRGGKWEIIPAN